MENNRATTLVRVISRQAVREFDGAVFHVCPSPSAEFQPNMYLPVRHAHTIQECVEWCSQDAVVMSPDASHFDKQQFLSSQMSVLCASRRCLLGDALSLFAANRIPLVLLLFPLPITDH
eukprot:125215-Pelagomonas_calceolata.AAC.2